MNRRRWGLLGFGCLALGVALLGRVALLRGVDDDGADLPSRADTPELRAIRASGARIRPLHHDKTPPQPGEWLDKHLEVGQTFDEYLDSNPNRPNAHRSRRFTSSRSARSTPRRTGSSTRRPICSGGSTACRSSRWSRSASTRIPDRAQACPPDPGRFADPHGLRARPLEGASAGRRRRRARPDDRPTSGRARGGTSSSARRR